MSCRLTGEGLEVGTAMAVALRLDGLVLTAETQAAPSRLTPARRVAIRKAIHNNIGCDKKTVEKGSRSATRVRRSKRRKLDL